MFPIIPLILSSAALRVDATNGANTMAQWNCPQCTFLNHPVLNECEICQGPRYLMKGTRPEKTYAAGDMVETKDKDGKWWAGTLVNENPDGTYKIRLDCGQTQDRAFHENMRGNVGAVSAIEDVDVPDLDVSEAASGAPVISVARPEAKTQLYQYAMTADQGSHDGSCMAESLSLVMAIRDAKYIKQRMPVCEQTLTVDNALARICKLMMEYRRGRLWYSWEKYFEGSGKLVTLGLSGWVEQWNSVIKESDQEEWKALNGGLKLRKIGLEEARQKLSREEAVILYTCCSEAKKSTLDSAASARQCIQQLDPNTRLLAKDAHAMCIVPDTTLPYNKVRVKNSWGTKWGQDGTFVMKAHLLNGKDADFELYSLDGAEARTGFTTIEWQFMAQLLPQFMALFNVTTTQELFQRLPMIRQDLAADLWRHQSTGWDSQASQPVRGRMVIQNGKPVYQNQRAVLQGLGF